MYSAYAICILRMEYVHLHHDQGHDQGHNQDHDHDPPDHDLEHDLDHDHDLDHGLDHDPDHDEDIFTKHCFSVVLEAVHGQQPKPILLSFSILSQSSCNNGLAIEFFNFRTKSVSA